MAQMPWRKTVAMKPLAAADHIGMAIEQSCKECRSRTWDTKNQKTGLLAAMRRVPWIEVLLHVQDRIPEMIDRKERPVVVAYPLPIRRVPLNG